MKVGNAEVLTPEEAQGANRRITEALNRRKNIYELDGVSKIHDESLICELHTRDRTPHSPSLAIDDAGIELGRVLLSERGTYFVTYRILCRSPEALERAKQARVFSFQEEGSVLVLGAGPHNFI